MLNIKSTDTLAQQLARSHIHVPWKTPLYVLTFNLWPVVLWYFCNIHNSITSASDAEIRTTVFQESYQTVSFIFSWYSMFDDEKCFTISRCYWVRCCNIVVHSTLRIGDWWGHLIETQVVRDLAVQFYSYLLRLDLLLPGGARMHRG